MHTPITPYRFGRCCREECRWPVGMATTGGALCHGGHRGEGCKYIEQTDIQTQSLNNTKTKEVAISISTPCCNISLITQYSLHTTHYQVLFFDRPTSDLDAQSALSLVTSLQRLARGNRLVAITASRYHHPTPSLLNNINNIISTTSTLHPHFLSY